jgi:hypothetical protein
MISPTEKLQAVLVDLENAIDELDQIHAVLKDLGLEGEVPMQDQKVNFANPGQPALKQIRVRHTLNIEQLVESAMGLFGTLQEALPEIQREEAEQLAVQQNGNA